ncbi:MAG: arginine--tRNA ligase [Rickettsiales bacterium]|nr:arginine--tRNA ligase [Rickettsiales bacterium]
MLFQDLLKNRFDKILRSLIEKKSISFVAYEKNTFSIEISQQESFGDVSSNIAMVLSKSFKISPLELANLIINEFKKDKFIKNIEIVKPGFINIFFYDKFWHLQLTELMKNNLEFKYKIKKKKICVEYVSANPTGLMHIGHARGAVLGDSICSLLEEIGYDIVREYYINDSGEQIKKLNDTIKFHLDNNKSNINDLPDGLYPGNYLKEISRKIRNNNSQNQSDSSEKKIIDMIMIDIKSDLKKLKVVHNNFVSEKNNLKDENIKRLKSFLIDNDLAYYGFQDKPKFVKDNWDPQKQLLFRSQKFGDDSDRALIKPNGETTYFMSDIIYHQKKIDRKFDTLINIWGVDHSGYVMRLKNALSAINKIKEYTFEIKLTALVNLMENNKTIKMSKRSGSYITLRDVLEKVGSDPLRYMMISRSPDKKIDFDLKAVLEKTKDNPVFYIQYAYARCRSILRLSENFFKRELFFSNGNLDKLKLKEEKILLIHLCNFPNIIMNSAINFEPHKLANYLYDLSKNFHTYWGLGNQDEDKKIFNDKEVDLSISRLSLVFSVSKILKKGLGLLKINSPEEM